MGELKGATYNYVTELANLGSEMEMQFSSFEVSDRTIDLVNGAVNYIEQQGEEIKRLQRQLEASRDVNQFLKSQLQQAEDADRILTKRAEQLIKALEFYANEKNYEDSIPTYHEGAFLDMELFILTDKGAVARQALEGGDKG